MFNLYDIAYSAALVAAAPYWLVRPATRRKVVRALSERMGRIPIRKSALPAVWIHAVSVGEMNATQTLIAQLSVLQPDLQFVVSTTTTTGHARGRQLYGQSTDVQLIRYPLDFTAAIHRALDAVRPSVVVLMELEVWPNFIRQCVQRGLPVMVANGRITQPSFRKYMRIKPVTRRMMQRLSAVCVQDEVYRQRFIDMGASPERVRITGTMKFDTAEVAEHVAGDAALGGAVGLRTGESPVWVCGSTGPGEEEIILDVLRRLNGESNGTPDAVQLVIVPRHPERFDEVAALIQSKGFALVRRSQAGENAHSPGAVVLGDTMGELRKFYSLADFVFVGRSLVDLGPRQHGSDMIEPAALAKAVVVGPFTSNFADAMEKLRANNAVIEVAEGSQLLAAVSNLLSDSPTAKQLGRRAQEVVQREKGATARHAQIILELLQQPSPALRR